MDGDNGREVAGLAGAGVSFCMERRFLVDHCVLVFALTVFLSLVDALLGRLFFRMPFFFTFYGMLAVAPLLVAGSYVCGELVFLGLGVTLTDDGIERKWFGRRKRLSWREVSGFKLSGHRSAPALQLFGADGKPRLTIPNFVDCAAIARLLEGMQARAKEHG